MMIMVVVMVVNMLNLKGHQNEQLLARLFQFEINDYIRHPFRVCACACMCVSTCGYEYICEKIYLSR